MRSGGGSSGHVVTSQKVRGVMVDSGDGKVVIVDMASLSEHESDGVAEVTAASSKKRTPSKSNGNVSNSESR